VSEQGGDYHLAEKGCVLQVVPDFRGRHDSCSWVQPTGRFEMNSEKFESAQEDLDPHRRQERKAAAEELAGRIRTKGVHVRGNETAAELDDILTAIDEFESAVMARGGDLMSNSPNSTDPTNPEYVLPQRKTGESAREYIARVRRARAELARGD
jgi:hypothetical protein